ncbi:MAG TPA: hypothetical protein VKU77_02440 [Streptosporangiaceae bacterium]|nr:hypothetical protein [Streptosporangiaceae bacterium]
MATRKKHTPQQVARKPATADRSAAPNDMIAAIMLPRRNAGN